MPIERLFRLALSLLFTCFSIIRIRYRGSPSQAGSLRRDAGLDSRLLRVLILFEVITLAIYLFLPNWLAWAALPLPSWCRVLGVGLGAVALIMFVRVHRSLGSNFSNAVFIREGHTLVTSGPYRRVRHPMYTAFYVLHLAALLIAANGFIGLTWIAGLSVVTALRVKREERAMVARFGSAYRTYMEETGRFLPPFDPKTAFWTSRRAEQDGRAPGQDHTP